LEEVVEKFLRVFDEQKNRRIVLYGLGENTGLIVKGCKNFRFVGLLDGYCTEGELWGLPVLDLRKLEKGQVDAVIMIARAASAKIIWSRICDICEEKHIDVYDMQGHRWKDGVDVISAGRPVIEVSLEYVQKQIADHEVISFDLFDTLLKRSTQDREVFLGEVAERCGVEKEYFIKHRMRAELARENATAGIDEIYQWIARNTEYDSETLCRIKVAEIEKEKKESIPCKEGRALFQYALELGKEIYLVSDMYLGRNVIEELLAQNEIKNYKELLISCEYGTGKRQGLFDVLLKYTSGRSCLHLGDSEEADGTAAKEKGIDAILIEEPEELKKSGKAAVFRYPVASRYRISSPYQLGYTIFAPLMAEFCEWLIVEADRRKPDCILFLARDGYLFEKMYELVKKRNPQLPEKRYFLFSRSVGTLCYIEKEEQMRYAAKLPYVKDKRTFMMRRFGLREEEVLCPGERETVEDYVMRHRELIFRNGAELRERFLKYYRKTLSGKKKVLLVDFVSTGSCQLYLEGILKGMGVVVEGAYFMRLWDSNVEKRKLQIASFLSSEESDGKSDRAASTYFLLEQVIKAPTGTVIGYCETGEPVLEGSEREENGKDENRKLLIGKIQSGILDYYERFLNQREEAVSQTAQLVHPAVKAVEYLEYLNQDMAEIRIKGLEEYIIRDVFTGRETKAGVYL